MRIAAIAVAVFVIFAGNVFAEFVDLGGDITLRGIYRNRFGLTEVPGSQSWQDTELRVFMSGEPLPDTSAHIRLIGERDWGRDESEGEASTLANIDLAYIVLHNIFGSRASVSAGRQELLYGEGFVVGRNPAFRRYTYERSPRKAFDAVRLSFDYEPFELDVFGAVIDEAYDSRGETLYGANLDYDYLRTASLDLGIFYKRDSARDSDTMSFSVRGESNIISVPGIHVKAEVVPQRGTSADGRDLKALGGYAGAGYIMPEGKPACLPGKLFANYYYMSGDRGMRGENREFDPQFSDTFIGQINAVSPWGMRTNARILNLGAGWNLSPVSDVEFSYFMMKRDRPDPATGSTNFGDEINMKYTYSYTASAEFSLAAGYFMPNPALGNRDALQITGAVSLSF